MLRRSRDWRFARDFASWLAWTGPNDYGKARSTVILFLAGAALLMASLAIPHDSDTSSQVLFGVVVIATVAGSLFLVRGDEMPRWAFLAAALTAVLLVDIAVYSGGSNSFVYTVFYMWIGLYAAYHLVRLESLVVLLSIAASSALVMLGPLPVPEGLNGFDADARWLMVVGTSVATGGLLGQLLRHVQSQSRTDTTTGLPNRRAWDEQLPVAVAWAKRIGHPITIALIDLDRFKGYNDRFGHQAGDRLLARSARVWNGTLRRYDFVARYGGEEFGVLLPACSEHSALPILDRMRLQMPEGLTCSVGAATWDGRETLDELVKRCDAALYQAKAAGRNRVMLAPRTLVAEAASTESTWTQVIIRILAGQPITVVYQPVVQLRDHRVLGYEALARPSGTDEDTAVAELFVVASRLGVLVDLDAACRRAAIRGAAALGPDAELFINSSTAALLDPGFGSEELAAELAAAGLSAEQVVIEISERDSTEAVDALGEVVADLRRLGVRFAVDNIGSGNSTFELLGAVKPEFVKLSPRMTQAGLQDDGGQQIKALMAYAMASQARVIAGGIEEEVVAHRMSKLGLELGQGYHLGAPAGVESAAG